MKNRYITNVNNNELIGLTRYYFNPNNVDVIWFNSNDIFKSAHRYVNSLLCGISIRKQIWKQK
jgi:hypothetical protein